MHKVLGIHHTYVAEVNLSLHNRVNIKQMS